MKIIVADARLGDDRPSTHGRSETADNHDFGASLSHPGGTMTGLTSTHTEPSAERIELLEEAFPATRRIAVLYFLAPSAAVVAEQLDETNRAAKVHSGP